MKSIDFKSLDKRINDLFTILGADDKGTLGILVQDPATGKYKIDFVGLKGERIKEEFDTRKGAEDRLKKLRCEDILFIEIL